MAKQKPDGSTKIRLIHDLRRSGINARITLHERIVLPRLTDVARDALDLMRQEHARHRVLIQIGVPSMAVRTSHKIAYYWQTTWTKADEALLEAK